MTIFVHLGANIKMVAETKKWIQSSKLKFFVVMILTVSKSVNKFNGQKKSVIQKNEMITYNTQDIS
jgi:hypothetical protein